MKNLTFYSLSVIFKTFLSILSPLTAKPTGGKSTTSFGKKGSEKKKSNLELFKEEIKAQHDAREAMKAQQRKAGGIAPVVNTSYQVTAASDQVWPDNLNKRLRISKSFFSLVSIILVKNNKQTLIHRIDTIRLIESVYYQRSRDFCRDFEMKDRFAGRSFRISLNCFYCTTEKFSSHCFFQSILFPKIFVS